MIRAKVRAKYQGLSRQELLDKAYELGCNYEINSQSCSQTTVAALHELLDIDDVVVRVATSLWRSGFVHIFRFEKAGAYSDPTKCGHIVGNAAR